LIEESGMGKKHKHDDKEPAVTLQTIADAMCVSRATVSNAFNRPDQLTPELREKILAKAKELKYGGPDAVAAVLRKGRTDTIGVIFTEALSYALTDPVALSVLQGIAKETEEAEIRLLLIPTAADRADTSPVRDAVVDSFILWALPDSDPQRLAALARRLPVVIVDGASDPEAAWIGIDERSGLEDVVGALARQGHRRFGIVTWPLAEDGVTGFADLTRRKSIYASARERLAGMQTGVEAAGIAWADVPVYECAINSQENGVRAAAALLDRDQPPTAILCMSDLLAFGAMQTALARGLAIPGDLSIAGFDDIPAAARSDPPLTTIRQPYASKGNAAARFLLEGWTGDPPRRKFPTEVIWRQTTGPAPA
jgi:DNA-binding LacI/PurR family transcriptional regulator